MKQHKPRYLDGSRKKRSGKWLLIPAVLLLWWCVRGCGAENTAAALPEKMAIPAELHTPGVIPQEKGTERTEEGTISDEPAIPTLLMPVDGVLTSGYGMRQSPFSGRQEFHPAVDLAAPAGSAILAALGGEVEQVGVSGIYGNYVLLRHQGGLSTMYSHCSKVLVEEGQQVEQGALLGLVGSTGRSTGPHLDFQLFRLGKNLDPTSLLGLDREGTDET